MGKPIQAETEVTASAIASVRHDNLTVKKLSRGTDDRGRTELHRDYDLCRKKNYTERRLMS
jgi:hypothetical protein